MNATFVETNPFLANGGDPKDPPQGIYYQDVGIQTIEDEFGLKTQVKFDLYVVNTTEYVPNRWFRSGRSASASPNVTGDLGLINLADDQICSFRYQLVNQADGSPFVVENTLPFFLFDFDTGLDEGSLTESLEVCGLDPINPFDLSETLYSSFVQSSIESVDLGTDTDGSKCFRFFATQPGGGENNPEFASDVFKDLTLMSPETVTNVLPNLLRLNFKAGLSEFTLEYQITAAIDPGTSGRNFLFTGQLETSTTSFIPCPPSFPPELPAPAPPPIINP